MNMIDKIEFILKELIQKNELNAIPDFFAKDYLVHTSKRDYKGHGIIKKWVKDLNQFLTDLKVVKVKIILETNDSIVWQRTLKGKLKPSRNKKLVPGKVIKWNEMIVSKFEDGLIVEEWTSSEFLGELISSHK